MPQDRRPLGERLQSLYEDAVCSPGFTFRGPATPIVIDTLGQARDLVPETARAGVDALLDNARATGDVPTDTLADVIGTIFLEAFLASGDGDLWGEQATGHG